MKKYKFLSIVAFAIVLCFLFVTTVTVSATSPIEISGENIKTTPGENISVDIEISNNSGFSALNLYYSFDERYFTLNEIVNKCEHFYMTDNKTTVWDASENYNGEGLLATLNFSVASDIPIGVYTIEINCLSASNEEFESVTVNTTNAQVVVKTFNEKANKPSLQEKTPHKVTLEAVEGMEYSLDGKIWQSSSVFLGLESGKNYTFYQRYTETETHYAGEISDGTSIITPLISAEVLEGELTSADVKSVTIKPIKIFENTFGEQLDSYTQEKRYCYCNWTSFLGYTIELKNGDIIEAPKGYFKYDDVQYELFSAHAHKDYEERWETGKTYTEWVRILGEEYTVNITVAPSPVLDIKIEPVTILEGTKCDTFDDYCVYRWYEEMPWEITLNNGETLKSNTQVVTIEGKNYSFEYSDNQSEDSPWKVGETHFCHASFMGVTVNVPVTITDTPIKNVEFEDIIVYENADGMYNTQYNSETNKDEEYFKYNWSQYISYKVTFIDGEELSGVGSGFNYNGEYYNFDWKNTQSLQNQWKVGNTYGQEVAIGGKTYTVYIEVEENPIKSVEIANITIPQGMNASTTLAYNTDANKHVEYLRYDVQPHLDYTITFKDGTKQEANRYGFNYRGRHYGATIQTGQNYDNIWQPNKVYYISVEVMGNANVVPVYIKPITEAEGFAYVVNNGMAKIMECHKNADKLIIPKKIGDYKVTEIQSLSYAKNFTKLYLPDTIESLSWIDFTEFELLENIYYEGNSYDWAYINKHYNGFGEIDIRFNCSINQERAQTPIFSDRTCSTVVLEAINGIEYSLDNENWQSSNVFTGLKPNTEYTFYQRYAETDIQYAGETSDPLTVKTYPSGTQIIEENGVYYYYYDGVRQNSSGFIQYDGKAHYCINGVWQKNFTGLVKHSNGNSYYVANGCRNNNTTGFIQQDGKAHYVLKGVWQKNYTGLVKHSNGNSYYVANGCRNNNTTGFIQQDGKAHYVLNGVWQKNFTGFFHHSNGNYYYVQNGCRNNITGTVKVGGKTYTVKNGVRV